MKIKAAIKRLASPVFKEYRFSFEERKSPSDLWTFCRLNGEIMEYIEFDKSNYANAIRVNLRTSEYYKGVAGSRLADSVEEWWEYQDQESLEDIIRKLIDLVVQKGMPWFECVAKPRPLASEELKRRLYDEKDMLSEEFASMYALEFNDPLALQKLQAILLSRKQEMEEVDWVLILGAAAYYGEYIRRNLGAIWFWKEETSVAILREIGERLSHNPMAAIELFWWDSYNTVAGYYRFLEDSV